MRDAREFDITRIGAEGDGVADTREGPVYVPFALPGERWREGVDGRPAERVSGETPRAKPVCRHFGQCGGCIAQHMPEDVYADWKRGLVVDAFAHRGIAADVRPLARVLLHSRRRAFLGVERRGATVSIGFREEGKHTLVPMSECPVLDNRIVEALPHLASMARIAMPNEESGRLIVTLSDNGLDVAFDNGLKDLSSDARAALAEMAAKARMVRLTVRGEPISERGRATITVDGVAIDVPQSIFLQAVAEAERHLIDLVLAAVPKKAKRALDLFCGIGTFTFPLARRLAVSALDSDKRAIAALQHAAKNTQGLKPIDVRLRDLFREPLAAKELDPYDCLVFDPPRAGAAGQVERIAKSKVPVVIAVSCAPATFARDARTLIDGGYKMGPVTPIDQFLYSAHVEAFAVFRK